MLRGWETQEKIIQNIVMLGGQSQDLTALAQSSSSN